MRQLQQELNDAVKKQSMSEASLKVMSCYCAKLEAEETTHLKKKKDKRLVKEL